MLWGSLWGDQDGFPLSPDLSLPAIEAEACCSLLKRATVQMWAGFLRGRHTLKPGPTFKPKPAHPAVAKCPSCVRLSSRP